MCDKKCECQNPQQLKGKVEKCSPEQIMECHGDATAHPCAVNSETSNKKPKA